MDVHTSHIKIPLSTVHHCCNNEKDVAAKCRRLHDQLSVSHYGIRLSVRKSKLVYSSLIFLDNKLTLICLSTQQQLITVYVRHTQVIYLSGDFCIFEDKSARQMGRVTQSATCSPILRILSPAN